MDAQFLRTLLRRSESDTLDFKRHQYRFVGAGDDDKSELLKDILAYANAWKDTDAYIVVGVEEVNGRAEDVVGAITDLKDHEVQQFFQLEDESTLAIRDRHSRLGWLVTVLTISRKQFRPLFLKKPFGRLKANTVYVRRGSSTGEADPDKIDEIGSLEATAAALLKKPKITLEFEYITKIVRSAFEIPMRCT